MADCCCENKALKVYKNYPTEFADVDWLSITFESEPIDLTGFRATFVLGDLQREWTDLTDGIIINLTDVETSALPVGLNYATLIVEDTSGNSKPFTTDIPVEVLTWVEGDQELDTYNMTVNALLDNETQMVIRIETAKVSLDWVLDKIAEHNASEEAHPYIQGLIDNEATARENADIALHNEIVYEATARGNADTELHNEIVSEATNRYNADILLHGEIVAEADIRERADIDLRNRIDNKQDKLTSENAGVGISIGDVEGKVVISNTGVRGISTGNTNGTISVNTNGTNAEVAVAGLGTAAYTSSTNYATSAQGTKADSAIQGVKVNGTELTPDADKKVDVTVPTVNNATLKIQKNGADVATFTANSSTDATANISVPTDTNDLTNGAGFITSSALSGYATETWVSQQGYLTSSDVVAYTAQEVETLWGNL